MRGRVRHAPRCAKLLRHDAPKPAPNKRSGILFSAKRFGSAVRPRIAFDLATIIGDLRVECDKMKAALQRRTPKPGREITAPFRACVL